jgi:hypothetical protein
MERLPLPHQTSHGVFTSKNAIDSISKGDAEKMYYTTQSRIQFKHKKLNSAEKGENCLLLYEGFKSLKNFGARSAPLHHRDLTWYSKDFFSKPNVDFVDNRVLAQSFRPPPTKSAPDLNIGGPRTQYEANFRTLTDEERKGSQQGRGNYEDSNVLGSVDLTYVKLPFSQTQFYAKPSRNLEPIRPVSAIHTRPRDHFPLELGDNSRYHLDFGPQCKERYPVPRILPRGASCPQPGGPPYLRMTHMAERQADYLTASKSFDRGVRHSKRASSRK